MGQSEQRVCLAMIVRDEAPVIARCLRSVLPLVDTWCIVDTGSIDDTAGEIARAMTGIPGRLLRQPWRDFACNRNQALEAARALLAEGGDPTHDYLYVIDADETLELPVAFRRPPLTAAAYDLEYHYDDLRYRRPALLAARLPWRYEGVLHEYLVCAGQSVPEIGLLADAHVRVRPEGARSRNPRKFHDDAALLEVALRDAPEDARNWFYLGQSWRDAGEPGRALAAYRRRVELPGWEEETWYALLQIAKLTEQLAGDTAVDAVRESYLTAYRRRPSRAETAVELARWHRLRGAHADALLWARAAVQTPRPDDRLFIDQAAYGWRALDELSLAAFYCGCFAEGAAALARLAMADPGPPPSQQERLRDNQRYFAERGHPVALPW